MKTLSSTVIKFIIGVVVAMLLLVLINVITLFVWAFQNPTNGHSEQEIKTIANDIIKKQDSYELGKTSDKIISEKFSWAMLINQAGQVVWHKNLPKDMPRNYTLSQVAGFSRWYLKGYPVSVWEHKEGLLVLGDAPDSYWKYNVEYGMDTIKAFPKYGICFIVVNSLIAFGMALGLGLWLYYSLKPLAKGIESLEQKELTSLNENGMFGDLARKINNASKTIRTQEESLLKRDYARINWIRGVSHDIRTPLSMIMGYATQIEEDAGNVIEVVEQAGIITRQSIRIRDLVNDLNLASKLEYDMQPLRKEKIYPSEIIRSIVATAINDGMNKGDISIYISDRAQKSAIMGDAALIKRALTNLLSNSILHNDQNVNIFIAARILDGEYVICVEDDGKGITKEKLKTLCTRQWNNVEDNKVDEVPHGMGLMIVRKIIEVHDGKWCIQSEEDDGFCYTLQIPQYTFQE